MGADQPQQLSQLRALAHRQPKNASVQLELGQCLFELGRGEEALPHFETARGLKPNLAEPYVMLGLCLHGLNRSAEAIQELLRAVELDGRNANAWSAIGSIELERGRPIQAATAWNEVCQLQPDLAANWINKGLSFFELGDLTAAQEAFESALKITEDAQTLEYFALCLNGQHHFGEAEEAYQKALKLDNASATLWNNYGICASNLQQFQEAEKAFGKALELAPNKVDYLFNLGELLFHYSSKSQAIEPLKAAWKQAPEDVEILSLLAKSLEASNPVEAIGAFEQLFKLGETNPQTVKTLANLYQANSQLEKEEELRAIFYKENPYDIENNFAIAKLRLKQGKPAAAYKLLKDCLSLSAGEYQIWFKLSQAFRFAGKLNEEFDCLELAIKGNADHFESWRRLGEIALEGGFTKKSLFYFSQSGEVLTNDFLILVRLAETLADEGHFTESFGALKNCWPWPRLLLNCG